MPRNCCRCPERREPARRPCRTPAWGLAAVLLWPLPSPTAQQPDTQLRVRTQVSAEALELVLTWTEPVRVEQSIQGRELYLQFNRPVRSPEWEALPAKAPAWIEGVAAGFDSLLFQSAREVRYEVTSDATSVTVRVTPAAAAARSPEQEAQAQRRLEILQARLYVSQGRLGPARELLEALAKKYPDDRDVLANLGRVEQQIGRWRRAEALYEKALRQDPGNDELVMAQTYLRGEQASRVQVLEERKSVVGRWSEQWTRAGGHARVTDSLRAGAVYDVNVVEAREVQRADGVKVPFDGNRHRGEFYVQNDFEDGTVLRGGILGGLATVGATASVARPDALGRTSLQTDFQRPFWEFIEGTIDAGVRDRVELRRTLQVASRWNARGAVAWNRYGLAGDPNVAQSVAVEGGLAVRLWRADPSVTLEYGLDGEYRKTIETRLAPDGKFFQPIPLLNREVHSLSAIVGGAVVSHFRADGYGGFAWDRLGGDGPFVGLRLTYDTPADFGAQLWFDRRLNTINTGERVNRLGGRVLWRF